MYEVSDDYLKVANSVASREFYIRCKFDGLSEYITYKHIANGQYTNIIDGNGILSMGNACANKIDLTIRNFDKQYIWEDSRFAVEKGLLVLGEIVWIPWGTFWVVDMSTSNDGRTLYLTAYDYMYKLSKAKYRTKLVAPFHYMDLLNEFLAGAGMTLADGVDLPDVADADYTILSWPDEEFYYSDIAGHLAGMLGMNARVAWADPTVMEFTWYTATATKVKDTLYQDGFEKLADSLLRVDYLVTGTNKTPDPDTDSEWDIVIENEDDLTDGELDFDIFDVLPPENYPKLVFELDPATLTASVSLHPTHVSSTEDIDIPMMVVSDGQMYIVNAIPAEGFASSKASAITLPTTLTTIGYQAFAGSNISSLRVPSGVTKIDDKLCEECKNLKTVYYDATAATRTSTLIANATVLGSCSVERLVVGEGVEIIPSYFCRGCYALKTITMPYTVTSIGGYAFAECTALESVAIPSGVARIGDKLFDGCKNLKTVLYNPIAATRSSTTISSATILGSCGVQNLYIGAGVISVPPYLGRNCASLTYVSVSSTVETISSAAFKDNTSIESIVINKPVDSISGSPWGASKAVVSWTGE